MKLFLSLYFFWIFGILGTGPALADVCRFRYQRPVLSLSGPVTHFFYRLGLFQDKNFKMISLYHGFSPQDFPGTQVGGGLFLSPQTIRPYQDPVVFFDQSREQKRVLEKLKLKDRVMIETLGDPFLVYQKVRAKVLPYLNLQDCEKNLKALDDQMAEIEVQLKNSPPLPSPVVFFLGKVESGKRPPSLIMINDGMVLFWVREKKISTYPSPLNYVAPSGRILAEMDRKNSLWKVGLVQGRTGEGQRIDEIHWEENGKDRTVNITHPSLLIPGLPQILVMRDMRERMEKLLAGGTKNP